MNTENVVNICIAICVLAFIGGCTASVINRDNKRSEDRIELWRCQDELVKEKLGL